MYRPCHRPNGREWSYGTMLTDDQAEAVERTATHAVHVAHEPQSVDVGGPWAVRLIMPTTGTGLTIGCWRDEQTASFSADCVRIWLASIVRYAVGEATS